MTNCRHFSGLSYIQRAKCCSQGHDVRAWIVRINPDAIMADLPCTGAALPLFDCPSKDLRTKEEVEQRRAEMKAHMDRFIAGMGALAGMRRKMIAHSLSSAKATCPWCGEKDALRLSCAIGQNNHMSGRCGECGEGFIE